MIIQWLLYFSGMMCDITRIKPVKTFLICAAVILLTIKPACAQFYETGQDPFSVSWRQIETKNFKLIFPATFEKSAQHFAASLDTFYPVSHRFLLKKPRPVSIVFHTQSSLSNGLVVYAPKRMELYTIPPQDNYPHDWLNQLLLHEMRHVVQLDALNQGLTRLGSFIIGQQAVGAAAGLVPRWFFEGDAVYSETMFSNAGRGRSASFLMPYRTLVSSSKKLYSYEKAMLGSYKHFVPDIYQMGYPIVKTMRDSFDTDIFGKALQYTARNPYLVFPFGHSLKINTGLNNRRAYEYTFNNLKNKWQSQEYVTYKSWPVRQSKTFTNYKLPVSIGDSMLLAQKWSLAQTNRFVVLNHEGKEKKQLAIGSNNAGRISYTAGKFIWSENKTDLRWTNRTYSQLVIFDMDNHTRKVLTRKTWYFSPAFSADGTQIAAVEETPEYKSSLVILDAASGAVKSKHEAAEGSHLQHPVWKENEIYCLAVTQKGKAIIKLNKYGNWEDVLPASYRNISSFTFADSLLIIAGENDGLNNLFVYNRSTKMFSQITNSRFGAFDPCFDANNNLLYFSEYTSNGYRISYTQWNPKAYTPNQAFTENEEASPRPVNTDISTENNAKDTTIYKNYNSEKYSRLGNLINIHSWLPVHFNYSVSDFSNPAINPGVMLLSQNLLGTLVSSVGYSYQKGYSHFHANVSYKALLPVISWSIDAGGPPNISGSNSPLPLLYKNNIQSTVNISLPLNLSQGRFASGFTPYMEWRYNRNAYYLKSENRYQQGLHYINYGANLYFYTRMAIRDLFPRFGFSAFARSQSTPFENKLFNEAYAASIRTYFPGLFKNHSFQLRYAFQYQSPLRYLYGSMIAFPAGYHSEKSELMHSLNSVYALPLIYPDFHAGPLFYLKRIRAHAFYDLAVNKYHSKPDIITTKILRSVGTDLIADIHILRIMFPFQAGARIAYLPTEKSIFVQAIFSVNLVY